MKSRTGPRWARVAAHGAFAVTVPSALWRVAMIEGALPGTEELRARHADHVAYVWTLSLTQLAAGALSLGLVRPWGERIGPVSINRWVPVILGGLGGLVVTKLFTIDLPVALIEGRRPDGGLVQGAPLLLLGVCYAPIVLWGPLELAAVAGYWWRRRPR